MPRNFFRFNRHALAIACFVFSGSFTRAQTTNQAVYWLRYQNSLNFSESFWWNNEIDNRRFLNPDVQTQFIVHSRVHYRRGHWEFGGGLTGSWAYAQFPETPISTPVMELRPVAEVNHEIPVRHFVLQQRVRVDNRFFEMEPEGNIFDEHRFVARFRYRLQSRFSASRPGAAYPVNIRVSNEIMVNDRENFFDQYRIYLTADVIVSRNFSIETGYIYIYQQRFGRDEFFNRHVLRFSILHKIFLY